MEDGTSSPCVPCVNPVSIYPTLTERVHYAVVCSATFVMKYIISSSDLASQLLFFVSIVRSLGESFEQLSPGRYDSTS